MANPFLAPSTLPFSLPPFADITDDDYREAINEGFAENLREIEAITENPDEPTFENTLIPLEKAGQTLGRVLRVFFNKSSSDSNDTLDAIEAEYAPKFAAHHDRIRLDSKLAARVAAVHDKLDELDLDPESKYLVERYHTMFTLGGASLDEAKKKRLSELNGELASLSARFDQNLQADTNDLALVIDDVAELDGLDDDAIAAAKEAATGRGLDGKYLITLTLFTGHPYLASLTRRDVRKRLLDASRSRGKRDNANDNRPIVLQIAKLRAERAKLLGFDSHAAYVTADETAKSPERVAEMLEKLAPAAAKNARAEQERLQQKANEMQDAAGEPRFEIEAHDWAFYTEKVREDEYAIDTAALRPFFEAERVLREGVFFAANQLYGVTFTERDDLVAYHPDARVFEVNDENGEPVGLFILDLYTRDSKRGGAWMNELVEQSYLLDTPVVVVNNLNVVKPAPGSRTLLSLDNVTTLFHEFGHALHGLFARTQYPYFSGTNVHRDFVEFPSQVNEMWILWPEVVRNYAKHVETAEPLPNGVIEKLQASGTFNEGFATSEYLAAALLDQAWHTLTVDDEVTDVEKFEADALARVGLDNPAVPTRYSSTYFQHVFSGGYSAGYYSYIWSEVLDADTVEWFSENGGLARANGDRFRKRLLGVGGSKDPLEAYRDFRGRDAVIEPLLKRRGLEV